KLQFENTRVTSYFLFKGAQLLIRHNNR
ncbi:hypothetical protein D039_2386B, partial [Vibrio parahaemolyticus EKP-028]